MESSGNFFDPDNNKAKSRNLLSLFIILTIFLTIACVILTWQLIEYRDLAKRENTAKTEAITQKENLLHKLKNLELEYDELSEEYEGLDSVFTKEKSKIKSLMDEIKSLSGSASNYQDKVAELETRLKDYLSKIDEMKSKNEKLTSENITIKNTLDSAMNINIELSSKNQSLADKIKTEAIVKAADLIAEGIRFNANKQEVTTKIAKKAQRIKTCFTIYENELALKGYKVIYIRIAEPDGNILSLSNSDTFTFKGKKIVYSAKKEIYYDNTNQDVCINWEKTKIFKSGIYYIDVFCDDALLGTASFSFE
ncbi:MAG TPA: hypothetical protein PKK00_07765 [Bacteroidales bacterium]|nr:hypothetical protein [Bacteroidales bacterium]HPS15847.1 hypothetical protein [Bacteroidales bacterium]